MRRPLLAVLAVSMLLAAALGLVTNYAAAKLPAFFAADPLRVWFVFGLLVLAGLVATLLSARLAAPPQPGNPADDVRRSSSREARRRARIAEILRDDLRRLAIDDEWRDTRYTELEAEVEVEVEVSSRIARLRRRLDGSHSVRVRRVPSLTTALRASDKRLVVLEGEPGSGKSVALRHLAHTMAEQAQRRPDENSVLPIYVNLKNLRFSRIDGVEVSAGDIEQFVLASLNPHRSRDVDRYLQDRFEVDREQGHWLFLFDSFDEIPAILSATEADTVIDGYAEAIAGFIGLGRSRGVIASREFRGPSRTRHTHFLVMPLSRERREILIRRADLDRGTEQALLDGLDGMDPRVQQLTDNPLFLSLLCEYVRELGALPQSTHAVIENYVRSRLARDRDRIEYRFAVSVDDTRTVAEEMAFFMLSEPDLGLSAERGAIVDRIASRLGLPSDEVALAVDALLYCKLARYASTSAGNASGAAAVTFSHRRIQEYFATCTVIRDRNRLSPVELLGNGRWRETAVAVLQIQRAEDSVDLLSAIERELRAATTPAAPSSEQTAPPLWAPGVLHLLDLMANALSSEDIAQHPVAEVADGLLDRAWATGGRLDQKWVVELCAAAGADHAVAHLTRAFDSESMWLRDEAYRQVRRVGPAAARLEPQIRQVLVDLSVGGDLRRDRRSVRAQMQRLPFAGQLSRVIDLLLAAPVVAPLAGPIAAALRAPLLPAASRPYFWGAGATAAVAMLVLISLNRVQRASNGRTARYFRSRFRLVGLTPTARRIMLVLAAAVVGLPVLLSSLVLLSSPASVLGHHAGSAGAAGLRAAVVLWVGLWPFAALSAAADGRWTARRYWPVLPVILLRAPVAAIRRLAVRRPWLPSFRFPRASDLTALLAFAAVTAATVGVLLGVVLVLARVAWAWIVPYGLGVAVLAGTWMRRLWRHHLDRRLVTTVIATPAAADVTALQEVLDRLRTEKGVYLFLTELRRQELHRDPERAEFLDFLSVSVEHRRYGTAAPRPDWAAWWDRHDGHSWPLRRPSSETVDELGRILEDARRRGAFRSGSGAGRDD